jgi:hypothetical protein
MKRYPYARLYLGLLIVMAIISALLGAGVIVMTLSRTITATKNLYSEVNSPLIVDTETLVSQMQNALIAVKSSSSSFAYELTPTGNLPIAQYASIKGKQIDQLQKLVKQYERDLQLLKQVFLEKFNENIDTLSKAARSELARVSPHASPLQNTFSGTMLFGDKIRTQKTAQDTFAYISDFLKTRVQYYSPSETAQRIALQADKDVAVAVAIYKSDLKVLETERNSLKSRSSAHISAQQRSQGDLLKEFIEYLSNIHFSANHYLLNDWEIENTFTNVSSKLDRKLAHISNLKAHRIALLKSGALSFLYCLGISLICLVIRDFLSAAIDTAQNTSATNNALQSLSKTENHNFPDLKKEPLSPLPFAPIPIPHSCDCPECGETMLLADLKIGDNGITKCLHCNCYFKIEQN